MENGRAAIVALLAVLLPACQPVTGRASVIDGDTLEIHGTRIRLWGIDAPEGRQLCHRDGKPWRCGTDAANALASRIGTQAVTCETRGQDRYRRVVAVCRVQGQDIGAWLVREGWALDFARYSAGAYAGEQAEAARDGLGMWGGEFVPPWEWRKRGDLGIKSRASVPIRYHFGLLADTDPQFNLLLPC